GRHLVGGRRISRQPGCRRRGGRVLGWLHWRLRRRLVCTDRFGHGRWLHRRRGGRGGVQRRGGRRDGLRSRDGRRPRGRRRRRDLAGGDLVQRGDQRGIVTLR